MAVPKVKPQYIAIINVFEMLGTIDQWALGMLLSLQEHLFRTQVGKNSCVPPKLFSARGASAKDADAILPEAVRLNRAQRCDGNDRWRIGCALSISATPNYLT